MGSTGAQSKEFSLESITDALRPVSAEYHADVRRIAEEAIAEFPDDDELQGEFASQSIDGNWWVIYTYAAEAVGMVSDNDDAWEGNIDLPEGARPSAEIVAYYAMEADVNRMIDALQS